MQGEVEIKWFKERGILNFEHKSVMLDEVLAALDIKPNGIYLDCTLGGGGHAKAIGEQLSEHGLIIGLDQDEDAISAATEIYLA